MTELPSLKPHFSRALAGGEGRLHLAAHSHHLWPDATFAGHMQAWDDAASLWDAKWTRVFDEILPEAQGHVALHLGLADPASIAFAPNTHEFVLRLLSALPTHRPPRVLTTDSEFHSFARQAARLAEDGLIELETIATAPFESFQARFAEAAARPHDLVFFGHVFFNSGFVVPDLSALVGAVTAPDTLVAIDLYHSFMALPVDIQAVSGRAFFLGGGYKYACAGEGACFMACPPGVAPRPRNTGWYAAFGALADAKAGIVPYAQDGGRFMGATFDPSGLYRLNAAMRWMARAGVGPAQAHQRARVMQHLFVDAMDRAGIEGLTSGALIVPAGSPHRGNFLAYRSDKAASQQKRLEATGIVTDVRGDVLRIGFGLYHDPEDVPAIVARVLAALS